MEHFLERLSLNDQPQIDNRHLELEEFIQILSESPEKYSMSEALKIFKNIIDAGVIESKFDEIMRLYPSRPEFALKVLQLISSQATTISRFYIHQDVEKDGPPCSKIEQEIWSEIGKMKRLKSIEIDKFYFNLEDLMQMCLELRHLTKLNVKFNPESQFLAEDPNLPKKFRRSFGQLKQFRFSTICSKIKDADSFQRELTLFCAKHLLNLVEIGESKRFIDMTPLCAEMVKTSQLHCLMLQMDNFEATQCRLDMFPLVQNLRIRWSPTYRYPPISGTKLRLLQKFSKLRNLFLFDLQSAEYLKFILATYGKKLNILSLNYEVDYANSINLSEIKSCCPNMDMLYLYNTNIFLGEDRSKGFTKLTELSIDFRTDSSEVCLSKLLMPPVLDSVFLTNLRVPRKELQITTNLLSEGKILKKIYNFDVQILVKENERLKKAIEKECEILKSTTCDLHPDAIVNIEVYKS
ncbi:Hypothetical predicted protein [Cloeon dipterum]|uniref:Uncharacterized protein n=1 Tax=Cloeon dipterum TaxID=197152 RepID=A0A8S1E416_9INSE|nr:Hypothetical predicted protein [Cloeon dipterum]